MATNAGDVLGGAALWEFDDNGTSKAYDDAVQGELDVSNLLDLSFPELLDSGLQFVFLKRWDAAIVLA